MSQPNEPRFEDDFDVDTDPYEPPEYGEGRYPTIEDIAIEKAHKHAHPIANNRAFYVELKEAYKAGFLEGFAYRLTEPTPDTGE
jgi:hypothetical protein